MAGIFPLNDSERVELVRLAGIHDAVCRLFARPMNQLHKPYIDSINHGPNAGKPPWVTEALMALEQLPSAPPPSPRRFDHRDAEYLYSETYDGEAPAQLMRLRTGLLRCAEGSAVTPKMGLINAMRATLFVASDDRRSELRRVVGSHVPSGIRDACGRLISTIKVQDSRVVEELLEQLHVHAWRQSSPTLHARMRGDALTKDVLRKIDEICEHLL